HRHPDAVPADAPRGRPERLLPPRRRHPDHHGHGRGAARGWFVMIRAARIPPQVEAAHTRLADTVRSLGTWDLLPFTAAAAARFQHLLRQRLNVGGNDIRTATIAREAGPTVVTRNRPDVGRVPGPAFEDRPVCG